MLVRTKECHISDVHLVMHYLCLYPAFLLWFREVGCHNRGEQLGGCFHGMAVLEARHELRVLQPLQFEL